MIHVFIQKSDEHYIGFRVAGHANYAPEGKDIVCAAVSALTITLENSLSMMTNVPVYEMQYEDQLQPGYMFSVTDNVIDILMESYLIGIEDIVNQYPDYVKLHLVTT